jgi:hypothetical protein
MKLFPTPPFFCQEATRKSKVTTQQNTQHPLQQPQGKLAVFSSRFGILRIGSKKEKAANRRLFPLGSQTWKAINRHARSKEPSTAPCPKPARYLKPPQLLAAVTNGISRTAADPTTCRSPGAGGGGGGWDSTQTVIPPQTTLTSPGPVVESVNKNEQPWSQIHTKLHPSEKTLSRPSVIDASVKPHTPRSVTHLS